MVATLDDVAWHQLTVAERDKFRDPGWALTFNYDHDVI
jgi:hypothetical protein